MNKSLTKEIINHIFTILGIWNNNGILSEHYLTQEKITGKYEDGQNFSFPIWAAELKTSDKTSLRCVVSDITDNGNKEYIIVCKLNESPLCGMRLSNDKNDTGSFLKYSFDWQNVEIFWQSRILSAFEMINSYGLKWESCVNVKDLVIKTTEFIEKS